MNITQPNPDEPSYCLSNLDYCAADFAPMFSAAMSSADFPWLNLFLIIALTIGWSA